MSIQVKINFDENELLSKTDFETMVYSAFPATKGDIAVKVLKNHMFLKEGSLYVLQAENIYGVVEKSDIDSIIWVNVGKLLQDSFNAFTKEDQSKIREQIEASKKMSFSAVFSKQAIMKYIDPIKIDLVRNIELDSYAGQLHFKNGFLDIKSQTFLKRDKTHFITKFINRDYVKSTDKQRELVLNKYLKPIYPRKEDLDCIVGIFGSALTGKSAKEQDMLFLLGEGSSGKSTILLMIKEAITIYFQELKSDTFSTSNSEQNKLANTYLENKQILITWINEMTSERINSHFFKSFVEGNCATTKLYKEGSYQFTHKSKSVATSNEFPNLPIDSGIKRRIRAYTHEAEFVDDESKVDPSKNIHLKVKDHLASLVEGQLLDAWIDILVEKASKYMNGDVLKYSENFSETKDIVVASNDYIQDFIDSKIEITGVTSDKLGKRAVHTKFHVMYPNRHLKELDIITSLKSRKIVYDKSVRDSESVRGCFIGVKWREENDNDDDALENGVDAQDQSITSMEAEIKRLKAEIAQLKKQPPKKMTDYIEKASITTEERYNKIIKEFNKTHKLPFKTTIIQKEEMETYYDLF